MSTPLIELPEISINLTGEFLLLFKGNNNSLMTAVFFSVFFSHYSHGLVHFYIPTSALWSLSNLPAEGPPPGVNLASFFIVLKLFNAYNFNIKLFHTIYFYHVFPPSIPTRSFSTSPTQPTLFFLSEDIQTKEHKSNQTNKKPSKTIPKQNKIKQKVHQENMDVVLC